MPRSPRNALGGVIYHVLNRGNERRDLFDKPADYDAFVHVLALTQAACPMRIYSYCVMRNHWHLVLHPQADGDLGRFMQRLTVTHVRRWREHHQSVGQGHLYQGTYKSFPVQNDDHFLTLCRYVERNALRSDLVAEAQTWKWSAAWQRDNLPNTQSPAAPKRIHRTVDVLNAPAADLPAYPTLTPWPIERPRNWTQKLNTPQSPREEQAIALSLSRGRPLGTPLWTQKTAAKLNLESTIRPRGRPRKTPPKTKS